jgi:hypothetical protein
MTDSYCGLCEYCRLANPDFQDALAIVKSHVDQLPVHWRRQCHRDVTDFSWPEFLRGLEWFQGRPQCLGCKNSGGLDRCAIRRCAEDRGRDRCYECPDHDSCKHLVFV